MFPRIPRHFKPLYRPLLYPPASLSSRLHVPLTRIIAAGVSRQYAQGPPNGGFPGGLQFGMDKMEKGQALKEFVSDPSRLFALVDSGLNELRV
jgi:hypothetical protein